MFKVEENKNPKVNIFVDRQPTIKKLSAIVKMGLVPQRYTQCYTEENCRFVNCFEHAIFNISNENLKNFDYSDKNSFCYFSGTGQKSDYTIEQMMNFIKSTGLEVEKCSPDVQLKQNQWKIALYVTEHFDEKFFKDFHLMIQEKDQTWTAKEGFSKLISQYQKLENYLPGFPCDYDLKDTYVITNPYAKEK